MTTTLKKVLKNKEGWRRRRSQKIQEEEVEEEEDEGLNLHLSCLLKRELQ